MELLVKLDKSLRENASIYFDKSKEAKKNILKIEKLIEETKEELKKMEKIKATESKKEAKKRKPEWFEKFHWCFSSEGFLILAGRDMQSNELLIKKYMEKNDIYFHAEIQGAAHCILKEGNKASEVSFREAAEFAAIYSKAWQLGFSAVDVYSVKPEQVSKKAPSGESLSTGAFMIYGERKWFKNTSLNLAIGVEKTKDYVRIISGPESAIKKRVLFHVKVLQGKKKKSTEAKKLKKFFESKLNETVSLDEIMRMLPEGIEIKF